MLIEMDFPLFMNVDFIAFPNFLSRLAFSYV